MMPNANRLIDAVLAERKQVGLLYHWTNSKGALGILKDNGFRSSLYGLSGQGDDYVSMTRSKTFKFTKPFMRWRFVVDGERVSDHFKIVPKQDFMFTRNPIGGMGDSEYEERIMLPPGKLLGPIKRYVIELEWWGDMPLDQEDDMAPQFGELTGQVLDVADRIGLRVSDRSGDQPS